MFAELADAIKTFVLKIRISYRKRFINDQDIRSLYGSNAEGQPHLHTTGIGAQWLINIVTNFRESFDFGHQLADLLSGQAENLATHIDVLPAGEIRMKAHAERFGTELVYDHINEVNLNERPFTLIGNNGSYICDATALTVRAYAADQPHETLGVNVTEKVLSLFEGKVRTELGKYADLFGDPAPGREKTLKLRVQDLSGRIKYVELPEDAPIVLP